MKIPFPKAVGRHNPVMGTSHGVTGMLWQAAEEAPPTLMSAREQDTHPDPPAGYPPSHRSVFGDWSQPASPAGTRSAQPGCASTTVPQTSSRSRVCWQTQTGGWKKGNVGALKCHRTSPRSLLVVPWALALAEGVWSRGGEHRHSVTAGDTALPTEGTSATGEEGLQ